VSLSSAPKKQARLKTEMPKVKAPKPTPKHLPLEAALKSVSSSLFAF
jgi:hypothetical protein